MSLVGRLEDLAISDIFQILGVGRKTGTLIVRIERGTALIVFKGGAIVRAEATALGDTIGEELLRALMRRSVDVLEHHPVNKARVRAGKRPANSIWLWGQGRRPQLPP